MPAWYEAPYDVMQSAYRRLRDTDRVERAAQMRAAAHAARLQVERDGSPICPQYPRGASGSTSVAATGSFVQSADNCSQDKRSQDKRSRRVAVLGLYSSGSTATAQILHCLGLTLGRELFGDFFEPKWLAEQLRLWWQEPDLIECVSRQQRVVGLAGWLRDLESDGHAYIGAKHPLLTLCGPELVEAWGPQTKFIWTWRPIDESVASLKRRAWWPGKEQAVQTRLWSAAEAFFAAQPHLRIEYADVLSDPQREVDRLIEFLELKPTAAQRATAVAAVRRRN